MQSASCLAQVRTPLRLNLMESIPSTRVSRCPPRVHVSPITRTWFLATKKPGPDTFPPGVLSPFYFIFILLFRWECQVLFQHAGTPERQDERSPSDNSSPTQRLNSSASEAPSWCSDLETTTSGLRESTIATSLCQGRPGEGCEQHTDVGSCRDSQLHKCGPGIASMGYDSCLC